MYPAKCKIIHSPRVWKIGGSDECRLFARVTGPQVCALRQQKKNSQAETVQVCLKSPFEIAIQQKWEQREKKGRKRREIGQFTISLVLHQSCLALLQRIKAIRCWCSRYERCKKTNKKKYQKTLKVCNRPMQTCEPAVTVSSPILAWFRSRFTQ